MSDLDDRIRAALREEDEELLNELTEQPGLAEMIRDGYAGRMRWLMLVMGVAQLVIFGLGVWATVSFVGADTVTDQVFWGVWLLLAALGIAQLKLLAWMQIQHAATQRELKRIELQLAVLARSPGDSEA